MLNNHFQVIGFEKTAELVSIAMAHTFYRWEELIEYDFTPKLQSSPSVKVAQGTIANQHLF